MNYIQSLIDRQLGIYCRFNYDNILKRLVVSGEESFYGLQSAALPAAFDQDPPIFACRFSEAPGYEHILALANEDGRVAIQDTSTVSSARSLEAFQCHNNAVFDLAWMPQNMNFVTVSGDHTASLWDVAEGSPKRVLVFSHHTRSVKTAAFRPNEPSVFATGARDGHILVWDIRAHARPCVVLKPDNCLANCHSGFGPKTPGSHGKRPRIDTHRAISITGLAFQDDLTLISCGECDGNIKAWDLRKNYNVYKREPLPKRSIPYCGSSAKNGYTNLVVDDARTRLYASCMDDVIYCFNIATYSAPPERRYVGHENGSFYIKTCLGPDGAYLASGSSDKHAYVWNVARSEPVARLAGHRAEVTCAAWCRRGDAKIVTCSDDARHKIWRIGRELPEPDADLQGRAEPVPRREPAFAVRRGGPDGSPSAPERKSAATPGSHGGERPGSVRKTKRCLADVMNAARESDGPELAAKRARAEPPAVAEREKPELLPAGIKRHRRDRDGASPEVRRFAAAGASDVSTEWTLRRQPTCRKTKTPTKSYEKRSGESPSPKSPKPLSPGTSSPGSRADVGLVAFTAPTKNLPNFVLDGDAPHRRLMSPVKRKRDATDWLTLMVREKRCKVTDAADGARVAGPGSPGDPAPAAGRNSLSEKTPRAANGSKTLLKYFSVTIKDK